MDEVASFPRRNPNAGDRLRREVRFRDTWIVWRLSLGFLRFVTWL